MKIGLVLDRYDPAAGGLERWTDGLARYLASRGHEPHILAFDTMATPPVPVHKMPPARGVLARARRVASSVASLGADVVLDTGTGWSGDVFVPCTGSRRLSQRRMVATHAWPRRLRAALSPRSRWLDLSLGWLERRQLRHARRIVAVSPLVRDLLVGRLRADPARVTVIPNGVDTARFATADLAGMRAEARAALGVADRVVFLGSAHNPWLKGMDTAIRALAHLPENAVLLIAGAAADARWAPLLAQAPGRVRFLGPIADMRPLFAAADALVHPTRWDAGSLSTLEAGAAGLPVITTAADGSSAQIAEGVTGFVLPDPEDAAALAERMRSLLDPSLRRRFGDGARRAAPAHDVALNYAAILAVLEDARRDQYARP